MIDVKSVTIGTDAEIPLQLVTGEFFPVTGLVGGTKERPRPLEKLGRGFAVQEDNVNLEINIAPARTADQLYQFIHKTIREVEKLLPPTIRLHPAASMTYRPELLNNGPCLAFGCDPDYCVYTGEENPRPKAADPNFRTAAAHIHVGWNEPTDDEREQLIKMLDFTIALPSIRYDDHRRRELYGKAGAYRPKEYGVEYRTPGNFWIWDYPAYIYYSVHRAIELVNAGLVLTEEEQQAVRDSINGGKTTLDASNLMDKHNIAFGYV